MNLPRRILVVGSGGREHALAWRLACDAHAPEVVLAPGNAGAGRRFARVALEEGDAAGLVAWAQRGRIDLVVVGPETPLAAGLVDALQAAGLHAFGPTAAAARLESSKWYAKACMREAGVPTARAMSACDPIAARRALDALGPPYVVKADGLAAGKGVAVTASRAEAEAFVAACLEADRFGASGRRVVIEECLVGEEISMMAVCDGETFLVLPPSRDHKRAGDGDTGPNTGGMGAIAPAPGADASFEARVAADVFAPMLATLRERGTPFRGLMYAGMIRTAAGPRVLEFNVRFGDPETQVVLPLLAGSFSSLLLGAAQGALVADAVARRRAAAVGVVLADAGYPDAPRRDGTIVGLDALETRDGILVFHAATTLGERGWNVRGGRAAHVVATGTTLQRARADAYAAVGALEGHGWRYRSDIGARSGAVGETDAVREVVR